MPTRKGIFLGFSSGTDGSSKDGSGFSMDSWTALHTNWIFGLSLDLQAFHRVGRIFIGLVFSKEWIGFYWIWILVLAWFRAYYQCCFAY